MDAVPGNRGATKAIAGTPTVYLAPGRLRRPIRRQVYDKPTWRQLTRTAFPVSNPAITSGLPVIHEQIWTQERKLCGPPAGGPAKRESLVNICSLRRYQDL